MAQNIRNTKSGRFSKKGSESDKEGTVKETVKRRHKLTVIFDLFKDAMTETDTQKKDALIDKAKERLLKLKPEEKAQMIEIGGVLYHEASVATDYTTEK